MLLFRSARAVDPHYYLNDLGRELEHLGQPQRARCGSAAGAYFPTEQIDEAGFRRLLRGQPISARQPLSSPRREVAAFEILCVAPKAVSVAALLGSDDHAAKVVAAHHEALDGALWYLEQHAAATGHQHEERVSALSGVRFTHGVSRSLDPHLHSHVLLANLGRAESGRFGALDQRGFRAHLDAASALYDATVTARCRELGFATALSPLAQAALSTRQAEARQLRFTLGSRRPQLFGRDGEKLPAQRGELLAKWSRQMSEVGLCLDDVAERTTHKTIPRRRLDESRFTAILLGDDRRITRRKVVEAWAWASDGAAAPQINAAIEVFVKTPRSRFEVELREADVIISDAVRRVLGNRPLEPQGLERWVHASKRLERTAPQGHRDRDENRARLPRSESHGWSR